LSGTDSPGRALSGKRIVVTRATEQAGELARLLAGSGAEVVLAPMVRFVEAEDTSGLDHAIARFKEFDWLLFTSANAVRFFLNRCRAVGYWPLPAGPRIAAVGPATRAAVEAEGLQTSLTPRESSGAALAAEFGAEWKDKQVLVPRSDLAGTELPDRLRGAGAAVTAVIAYRTADPEALDPAQVALLRQGPADAITFFSPSAFRNFAGVVGDEALCRMCARVAFAAVGPTTAAAIRGAGVPVAVEALEATAASLVTELDRYFAGRSAQKARCG
jgi:uroporphyrinogen III methyltransferase / synthase